MAESDGQRFEIPAELKISTCFQCGATYEDGFIARRIENSIKSQKEVKAGYRLQTLRWLDSKIDHLLSQESKTLTLKALIGKIVLCLEFRDIVVKKGLPEAGLDIREHLGQFLLSKFPSAQKLSDLNWTSPSVRHEIIDSLREFVDVWVFAI